MRDQIYGKERPSVINGSIREYSQQKSVKIFTFALPLRRCDDVVSCK
jgi:hypothetical protein